MVGWNCRIKARSSLESCPSTQVLTARCCSLIFSWVEVTFPVSNQSSALPITTGQFNSCRRLGRLRASLNRVSQTHNLLDVLPANILKDLVKREAVAVNIRNDC